MGARKKRSTINVLSALVYMVQEIWENKKLAGALFMDIKEVFDHVSRSQLLKRMIELGIKGDLVS